MFELLIPEYALGSMQWYSVRPSVRPSVCLIYRPLQQRAAGCCCGPGGYAISINSGGRHALQQHGAQQQMRAVSCCQLMYEGEHMLFVYEFCALFLKRIFALNLPAHM